MKKLFILLILSILILSGCSSKEKTGNKPVSQTPTVDDVIQQEIDKEDNKPSENTETPKPVEPVEKQEDKYVADVDLTVMSSIMVYSEVSNMVISPKDYIGKTVKMKGQFAFFQDEIAGVFSCACVIMDATACCAQGIEFELTDDYTFPKDYPEKGAEICVYGTFDTYTADGMTFCILRNAVLV